MSVNYIDIESLPEPIDIFELYRTPESLLAPFVCNDGLSVEAGRARALVSQVEQGLPASTVAYFSGNKPNSTIQDPQDLVLPPAHTCRALEQEFCEALARGAQSVHHPSLPGVLLPLFVVHLWKHANHVNEMHHFWGRHLLWTQQRSVTEHWPAAFRTSIISALNSAPFFGGSLGHQITRGATSFNHLVDNLLSSSWITDDGLACMLAVIRHDSDIAASGERRVIADPTLWPGMRCESRLESATARVFGAQIGDKITESFVLPMNVDHQHWLFADVNVKAGTIEIGNSLPSFTKRHLPEILKKLAYWIDMYDPYSMRSRDEWEISAKAIATLQQKDDNICAAATANGIHARVDSRMKIWRADRAGALRAYYVYRCICLAKNLEASCSCSCTRMAY
jgi:hypothetical protein